MKNALSLIKDSNLLKMVIAVVIGVFFVVGGVSAATTISTNIDTAGTLNVDDATTLNGAVTLGNAVGDDIVITGNATSSKHFANRFTSNTFAVGGTATSTFDSAGALGLEGTLTLQNDETIANTTDGTITLGATNAVLVGTASTSALRVGDEIATTINGLVFGYCTLAAIDVSAATTTYAYCTGATGVISGDRVFVQATSSMPTATWITAASSTATAGQINVRLHADKGATAIDASTVSLNVWAVRD